MENLFLLFWPLREEKIIKNAKQVINFTLTTQFSLDFPFHYSAEGRQFILKINLTALMHTLQSLFYCLTTVKCLSEIYGVKFSFPLAFPFVRRA